jgi:hypothetical protein
MLNDGDGWNIGFLVHGSDDQSEVVMIDPDPEWRKIIKETILMGISNDQLIKDC